MMLVLMLLARIDVEQHFQRRRFQRRAGGRLPDFGGGCVEAEQGEVGVVLSVLVPACDDRVPQAVDHAAVGRLLKRAMDMREQAVPLANEGSDRAVRLAHALDEMLALRGEEIDLAAVVLSVDLGGHRPGAAVLDALEAKHQERRIVQFLPEFLAQFGFGAVVVAGHRRSPERVAGITDGAGPRSAAASVVIARRRGNPEASPLDCHALRARNDEVGYRSLFTIMRPLVPTLVPKLGTALIKSLRRVKP